MIFVGWSRRLFERASQAAGNELLAERVVGRRRLTARPMTAGALLVALLFVLQSQIPLGTAVQIGSDEGFELAKATLSLHGHKLYSEVWNDQPPLFTYLLTEVLRVETRLGMISPVSSHAAAQHVARSGTHAILGPRLLTCAFAGILLFCVFLISWRITGMLVGILTVAMLIASPGFLELSSSSMLEVPSIAPALMGLAALLLVPRTRWHAAEILCGIFFGIAVLTKLVPLFLLPLTPIIVWIRQGEDLSGEAPRQLTASARGLFAPLLVIGALLMVTAVALDGLAEHGMFLLHFQQSWSSHFGKMTSITNDWAARHAFNWRMLLSHGDVAAAALVGLLVLATQLRTKRAALLPMAWLILAMLVFTIHKPWWRYYYVHIAIPLCWCAGIGIVSAGRVVLQWLKEYLANSNAPTGKTRGNGWRFARLAVPFGLFAVGAMLWSGHRAYREIARIRSSPSIDTSPILEEIERFRPYTHWMYTDRLVYSFHADIPLPPPLAVVPLKRLWIGDMTPGRIAREVSRYRPEIILLRNDASDVPFESLLQTDYQLVFRNGQLRLFVEHTVIDRLNEAELRLHLTRG